MQGEKGGSLELEVNVNVNAREVDFPVRGPPAISPIANWYAMLHY